MQHDHQRVPVTALAFLNDDVVLAGGGFRLAVYSVGSKRRLTEVLVFNRQAIHGIIVHNDGQTVIIWGGELIREVRITCLARNSEFDIALGPTLSTGDWTLDAAFAPCNAQAAYKAVAVTAHNALMLVKDQGSGKSPVLEEVLPGSNCILYSAHVKWLCDSQCLIASGTAFGDIVLWSAFLLSDGKKTHVTSQIHYNFSAHQGSVFGVQLSPMLKLHGIDHEVRILASCSDDRTIRLWDVSDLSQRKSNSNQGRQMTGFGHVHTRGSDAPRTLAMAMGHVSRIWHVRFLGPKNHLRQSIISFGEDASTITWDVLPAANLTDSSPFQLVQACVETRHSGKNIWSGAIDSKTGCCITGGADGAIVLPSRKPRENAIDLTEIIGRKTGDITTNVRVYCFVDNDTLICTADTGEIKRIELEGNHHTEVTSISSALNGLKGYSIVTSVNGVAFVAGHDGIVYACSPPYNQVKELAKTGRKVAGLFASSTADDQIQLLITSVCAEDAQLLTIRPGQDMLETDGYQIRTLTLPPNFVVTSFVCVNDTSGAQFVVLGSRNGHLVVFTLDVSSNNQMRHTASYHEVHGREAVTSLASLHENGASWIYSTGRDGSFAVHQVRTIEDGKLQLSLEHQLALPLGPNVEGLDMIEPGRLRAYGFKGKKFVVYDILAQQEDMSVECGGAHRNWTFRPSASGGTFVWTKASRLYYLQQERLSHHVIHGGGHGREIKALAVSSSTEHETQMIATGAEDTNIKLWRRQSGQLKCLHTLRKHNTGIQHLLWVAGASGSNDDYLFSSGGFEEFFIWRTTSGLPHVGTGVVCESKHPRSGASDLRIMAFDARRGGDTENNNDGREATFTVLMAYSDSTVKLWRYESDRESRWTHVASGDYLTACLTQVQWLRVVDGHEQRPRTFLTASTDGHIAFWRRKHDDDSFTWISYHRLHRGAIHVLATVRLSNGSNIIVTGGDDNAICVTLIGDDGPIPEKPKSSLRIGRAHAAAVTAVCLRRISSTGFEMLSAGLDQCFKRWRVDMGDDAYASSLRVTALHSVSSPVADVSSMALCGLDCRPHADGLELGDHGSRALRDKNEAATILGPCNDSRTAGDGVIVVGVGMAVWKLAHV